MSKSCLLESLCGLGQSQFSNKELCKRSVSSFPPQPARERERKKTKTLCFDLLRLPASSAGHFQRRLHPGSSFSIFPGSASGSRRGKSSRKASDSFSRWSLGWMPRFHPAALKESLPSPLPPPCWILHLCSICAMSCDGGNVYFMFRRLVYLSVPPSIP